MSRTNTKRKEGPLCADLRHLARCGITLLLLIGGVGQSLGKEPVSQDETNLMTLGELEALQTETLLYEARLARDKARNELKKYDAVEAPQTQVTTPSLPSDDTPSYSGKSEISSGSDKDSNVVLPLVIQIFGQGNHLKAKLLLSSSRHVTVSQGSGIPGTPFVVRQITPQRVDVQKPGEPVSALVFAQ